MLVKVLVWGRRIISRGRTKSVEWECHNHRILRECLGRQGVVPYRTMTDVYVKQSTAVSENDI